MPLEQLMPAPEMTTARRHLATASEMSDSCLRAGKSAWSVEDSSFSRGSDVIVMLGGRRWMEGRRVSDEGGGSACLCRWSGFDACLFPNNVMPYICRAVGLWRVKSIYAPYYRRDALLYDQQRSSAGTQSKHREARRNVTKERRVHQTRHVTFRLRPLRNQNKHATVHRAPWAIAVAYAYASTLQCTTNQHHNTT